MKFTIVPARAKPGFKKVVVSAETNGLGTIPTGVLKHIPVRYRASYLRGGVCWWRNKDDASAPLRLDMYDSRMKLIQQLYAYPHE